MYAIYTMILLPMHDIYNLYIGHVDKGIFVYISKRQMFYIRYIQNIIVYSPYRQFSVNNNKKHYLYIFMYYQKRTNNSIFTSFNSVYIKSEQWLLFFRFSMFSLYQWKLLWSVLNHKRTSFGSPNSEVTIYLWVIFWEQCN